MIAVTGATGQLGQLVIRHLLKKVKPSEIVAIVRNPAKAEELSKLGVTIRKGDYEQPALWGEALKGVKRVLLISSNELGKRVSQHTAVINAAKEAKIELLAYTSLLKADSSSLLLAKEHLETEKAIIASGVPFTFLRNGWYFENDTNGLKQAIQNGAIVGASGDGKLSSASRDDFAQAAATVLTSPGHENKIYELGGDSPFTMTELALEVSKQSGTTVSFKNLSPDEYKKMLLGFGLPEEIVNIVSDANVESGKGQLHTESKDLSKLIGHPTTSLAVAVANALK